jgi:hypothetical protein
MPAPIILNYNDISIQRIPLGHTNRVSKPDNSLSLILCDWYMQQRLALPYNNKNSILLANTEEEKDFFESKYDTHVIYCNHNAFLHEDRFIIKPEIEKNYDMIISSCFNNYKCVSLAKEIPNVLHMGYKNSTIEYIPDFGFRANFKNNSMNFSDDWRWICTKEHVSLLNSSICGGIFSKLEGACFSSSEYLLCGLPVISTPSVGGRDVFYTPENSIICEPTTKSVKDCFDTLLHNIDRYDKYKIREAHIIKQDIFRNNLTSLLKDIIEDKYKETVVFEDLKSLLLYYDTSNIY